MHVQNIQPIKPAAALLLALLFCACGGISEAKAASTYYVESGGEKAIGPAEALYELPTRTDNFDEEPVFSGGEVKFLENTATKQQQLCGVFKSSDGKVLVVDGGVAENTPHLIETVKGYGGTVHAWLITHPQDDHAGALLEILRNHPDEINIENIYYHFNEYEWYGEVAPSEQVMVWNLLHEFEKLPQEKLHGEGEAAPKKDTVVTLSEQLSFRVLNDPQKISGPYAVNNSSLLFDICMDGKHIIVLGDLGPDGGDRLLPAMQLANLTADYVVMSHHGQNGVRENFYRALDPKACIWSCPDWLFNAAPDNKDGLKTHETKAFVNMLGITKNYCTKDGDVTLR